MKTASPPDITISGRSLILRPSVASTFPRTSGLKPALPSKAITAPALVSAPAGMIFYTIQIIEKGKCKKCSSNFGIEMTDSKLVDRKETRMQDRVRIHEIHRNTYTCKFCGDINVRNEPKITQNR
ncbi:MAG: hypothetical protein QXE84_00650 [Candidatus Nitrosotenuis sp.]